MEKPHFLEIGSTYLIPLGTRIRVPNLSCSESDPVTFVMAVVQKEFNAELLKPGIAPPGDAFYLDGIYSANEEFTVCDEYRNTARHSNRPVQHAEGTYFTVFNAPPQPNKPS